MSQKKPAKKAPAKKQAPKKSTAKKQEPKKPAKKAAVKKAQAPAAPKRPKPASTIQTQSAKTAAASVEITYSTPSREETRALLEKVAERATSTAVSSVVRANDVVNKTLRQRMLAWFKKDK